MADPLVSIIIPCFNAEQFVGEAIASALGQTYPHKEVIVIDDGSTDGSLDVLKSFGDAIRWETGPNRGACAARNRGLELANGELIQFLDSDDLLDVNKLQKQAPLLTADPGSMIYCDGEASGEDERQSRMYRRKIASDADPVVYMLRGGLPTPAPIHWRRNLEACHGFRENLICAQERDLHLRLACHGVRFRHLSEVLYIVRRRHGSISSDSLRVLDQHSDIAWHAYELLRSSGRLTEERAAALAGFLAADARQYLLHGKYGKAREYLAQARQFHPDGGIPQVCGPVPRLLHRAFGTRVTQRLIEWKWRATPRSRLSGT